jgi:uncharacterized protein YbjT (DUF2867 family)
VKILIFGATGSAGGSVLRACLADPAVERIHAIARRLPAVADERLRICLHEDFLDYATVYQAFAGIDACLFCLGKSVSQVSGEAEYRMITHDYALAAAHALEQASPGAVFHYVSGRGTNAHGRLMWARVKGQTERELIDRMSAVCWRPAAIAGEPSDSAPWLYQVLGPAISLLKPFRSLYIDGQDLGRAMLQATRDGTRGRIFENAEIRAIADRARTAART